MKYVGKRTPKIAYTIENWNNIPEGSHVVSKHSRSRSRVISHVAACPKLSTNSNISYHGCTYVCMESRNYYHGKLVASDCPCMCRVTLFVLDKVARNVRKLVHLTGRSVP